ncbi:MAG: outer membrane protein transport protein [Byssovorax sp.]
MTLSFTKRLLGLTALAATVTAAHVAPAAGLYYGDRGVRPLGRAGAFIAGGDDLGAIAYNPAGLYDAGAQVLIDGSWVNFSSDYTRQTLLQQVDPNTGKPVGGTSVQTFAPVQGKTPFLPIPTLAVSFQPHPKWVVALGVFAPYAALPTYPSADDFKGKTTSEIANGSPQRYSLVTLDGSILAVLAAGAAFAPSKSFRLGVTAGMLTGKFSTRVAFSGCIPERFLCAQESPSWDVLTQLDVGPIFSPYGSLGAVWIPDPSWRIGVSSQLPIYVRASATVKTRLPATPIFENARQDGEDASVAFDLPWNLKWGLENRPIENLRIEIGGAFERWSMHDSIRMTPHAISLTNVALLPKQLFVPPIALQRNFQDSASVRLGGEYGFEIENIPFTARAGVSYESSAIPKEYLSVLTLDAGKITTALGASVKLGKLRIDATFAHLFAFDTTVAPNEAKITQVSPVVANPAKNPDYINGGVYNQRANVIGLGIAYTFEPAPIEVEPAPEPKAGDPKAKK